MTALSINVNKPALLRNSRGSNFPDLIKIVEDCERFGADGITVHPRPDERHVRYQDCIDLKQIVKTELNIEGNPNDKWMQLVLDVLPEQASLVPDAVNVLTSDAGWDCIHNASFLKERVSALKEKNIRVSLFMENDLNQIEKAKEIGADRIELYTGPYAVNYNADKEKSIKNYFEAAKFASSIGLEINAGHDLNLENLKYFKENIPKLKEVSIGHALWVDCIYYGFENTVQMYKRLLGETVE